MHTEKVLVLSTANIRVETSDWLSAQAKTSTAPDLIVYDKDIFGFWIPVPTRQQMDTLLAWEKEMRPAVPPEVFGLIWVAFEHGCEWIMLDRDADASDLPTWEW